MSRTRIMSAMNIRTRNIVNQSRRKISYWSILMLTGFPIIWKTCYWSIIFSWTISTFGSHYGWDTTMNKGQISNFSVRQFQCLMVDREIRHFQTSRFWKRFFCDIHRIQLLWNSHWSNTNISGYNFRDIIHRKLREQVGSRILRFWSFQWLTIGVLEWFHEWK